MEEDSERSLEGDEWSFCGDSDNNSHNIEDGSSDCDSDGSYTEDSSGSESVDDGKNEASGENKGFIQEVFPLSIPCKNC